MPRTSKAALSVVTGLPGQRQRPPTRLSAEAAEVWREIVAAKPHDWFTVETRDLLEAMCTAVVMYRAVAAQLGTIGGKQLDADLGRCERLARLADRQVRLIATLATKLRLTNQARYTPQAAATASRKAKGARPWDV